MPLEDKALRLRIMREIAKRNVDATRLQVSVLNNIVTLTGELRPLRGRMARDSKQELETIREILLTVPKVREVIVHDVRCF
jgi:osmotically-inducible protein OsmY